MAGFHGGRATEAEARRIVGACYGFPRRQVALTSMADAMASSGAASPAPDVEVRTVPRQTLFYLEYEERWRNSPRRTGRWRCAWRSRSLNPEAR